MGTWKSVRIFCAALLVSWVFSATLGAETLRFRYRNGEQYRILSEIQQDVFLNEQYQFSTQQLNRLQVQTTDADEDSGHLHLFYQNSVEGLLDDNQPYQLDREYTADFIRDAFGEYDIDAQYYVPTVRDVPIFPDKDLQPGDTWSAPGYEVHDLRDGFDIQEVFLFPMPVTYRYMGKVVRDGIELEHIVIEYNVYHRKDVPPGYSVYPYLITGMSRQNYYFDNVLGRPHYYDEVYDIMLHLNDGSSVRYTGSAQAEVIESQELDRDALSRELEQALDDLGVENSTVTSDERGVTISLENIQFEPDSARLLNSELAKIQYIAQILSQYPERDILVSGHTALAGTAAGRQRLSEERAKTVVDYLIELGVRDRSHIMFQGFGAQQPIDSNDTLQGMQRNRRVEITILEN